MKYQISECILEVTRRCNMCCDHCLRGDAQNSDLDLAHVKKLFSHIDSIDTLTLTGGEPSLVPEIIQGIADAARENNVNIERFYMATNGKK